eukprot:scaffold19252_cov117-Isochrysis_galbana.AAC.7
MRHGIQGWEPAAAARSPSLGTIENKTRFAGRLRTLLPYRGRRPATGLHTGARSVHAAVDPAIPVGRPPLDRLVRLPERKVAEEGPAAPVRLQPRQQRRHQLRRRRVGTV